MKSRLPLFLPALSAALLLPSAARAGLLAYEPFDYPNGQLLPGQVSNATGFTGVWRQIVNNAILTAGSLEYSGAGGTLATSGNHPYMGQGRNLLDINPAAFAGYLDGAGNVGANGTTIYVSFLMQLTAPGSDPIAGFGFHRDGDADANFHIHLDNSTANHGGSQNFFLTDFTGPALNQNAVVLPGPSTATNLFVLRFDFAAGPDTVRAYANPPLGTEPASANGTITGANLSFDRVAFANFGGGAAELHVDEIRIGTTYASVTPAAAPPVQQLDLTFNTTGRFTADLSGQNDISYRSAIQPDGKIVSVGYTFNGTDNDFMVMRTLPNGGLDPSFGTGGKTITPVSGGEDFCNSITLQSDGKIIAAGYSFTGSDYDYALVRFNANGSLDTTFGTGGKVTTAFGPDDNYITNLTLQPDGKILAVGYTLNEDMSLARYNPDGSLDASFGNGGIVLTDIDGSYDYAYAVAVQNDAKIVIAGFGAINGERDFAVVRYLPNGSLDPAFGNGGKAVTQLSSGTEAIFGIAIQPDGKIVGAGYADNGTNLDFGIVRFMPNGTLDAGFAGGGKILYPIRSGADIAQDVVVQNNGKIFVAGYGVNSGGGTDVELLRLNANGTPDTSFDGDGKLITPAGGNAAAVDALLMPDGRVLVTGFVLIGGQYDCLLIRYAGEPAAAILVRNGTGANDPFLFDGQAAAVNCGNVPFGQSAAPRTFTISNGGRSDLTGIAVSIDGANSGDFALSAPPVNALTPGSATTFTVTFTPSAPALLRTAAIHIVSNDPPESPFDFPLSGSGLVTQADWRQFYFGTSSNSGSAADTADFDGDGISNLVEFATGTNPAQGSGTPGAFQPGNLAEFIFSRSHDAINAGISLTAERNGSLTAAGWTSAGITLHVLSDDGHTQQVCATLPDDNAKRRFVRLTATAP